MDSSKLLTIEQARALLGRVGVDVPQNTPPQTVFASLNGLLNGVPNSVVAAAAIPGAEVRVSAQAGVSLPPFSPLNYQFNVGVEGRVKLSDVETGTGFQQTQTFKASVQLQQEDRVALEKTLVNRLYNWSKYSDHLPADAKKWLDSTPIQEWKDKVDKNPALKTLVSGPPISIAHTEFQGSRLTYEAIVTPEQGRKIAAGDKSALPNPLDPLSMPAGSSVLVRGQDLKGSNTDIGYKFGLAGVGTTQLDGSGFGVRRLEGSMVEVYSGPMSTIENSTYLGLGRRTIASARFEIENTMEQRQLSVARLDLSTPEGQTAYKQFLEGGKVPDKLAPGIAQVGHSQEISIEHARKLGLTVGSASISFDNSSTNLITVGNLNGKEEVKFNYNRAGQIATESTYALKPDGKVDFSNGQYKIMLPDLGADTVGGLRSAYGGHSGTRALGEKQSVEMSFDSQQLMELRERSRAYIAAKPGGAELLKDMDAGKPIGMIDPMMRIAGAKTPVEVFGVMQNHPQDIPGVFTRLDVGVSQDQRRPMPGTLNIQPPAEMRTTLEQATDADRAALIDKFYRAPPSAEPKLRMGMPEPTLPSSVDRPGQNGQNELRNGAADTPRGPSLTSSEHPDHALFAAMKSKAPPTLSDDQVGVLTAYAKQAGITANRLEQVAVDPARSDQMWIVGSVPGFRAKVDLSQTPPPLEQTSSQLLAQAPAQARTSPEPQPRAAMQQ